VIERSGSSWLWSNWWTKCDFEDALSAAVVRAAAADAGRDIIEELTNSIDELSLSLMVYPVDIGNKYRDLKASLRDLLNE
jgi:hypothetical protein